MNSNRLKKFLLLSFFIVSAVLLNGCNEYKDERVNLDPGVKSDTLVNNALTRPVYAAFNLLAGEGIKLTDVKVITNDAGFMVIQITGYNRSVATKRFDYKVEWVDKNGIVIDSKAKVWQTISAKARNNFSFNVIAPSKDAVDFKMNTRKTPKKG
jgi:uncharacterized protein YcfL